MLHRQRGFIPEPLEADGLTRVPAFPTGRLSSLTRAGLGYAIRDWLCRISSSTTDTITAIGNTISLHLTPSLVGPSVQPSFPAWALNLDYLLSEDGKPTSDEILQLPVFYCVPRSRAAVLSGHAGAQAVLVRHPPLCPMHSGCHPAMLPLLTPLQNQTNTTLTDNKMRLRDQGQSE